MTRMSRDVGTLHYMIIVALSCCICDKPDMAERPTKYLLHLLGLHPLLDGLHQSVGRTLVGAHCL